MFPGQVGTVSKTDAHQLKVGDSFSQTAIVDLRSCNADKIQCRLGIGKVQSQVTLLGLNTANATVSVELQLDVGKTQTVGSPDTGVTYKLSDDVATLRNKHSATETLSLDYNRFGSLELPYGVALKLCVEAPATTQDALVSGCQGQEVELSRRSK
ncbi:hypothetical protein D3C77_470160 [compost metagenome]